jgi:hypothetical protein
MMYVSILQHYYTIISMYIYIHIHMDMRYSKYIYIPNIYIWILYFLLKFQDGFSNHLIMPRVDPVRQLLDTI